MTKTLLTLGDSWPEGAELESGERYGDILCRRMGFDEFYNFGAGGASNEDLMYQLQRYISDHHNNTKTVTAIFFLTNPARTAHFPRFFSWANAAPPLKELYLHFHDAKHQIMRSSATVSALQHWCQNLGINDYYFAGWVRYCEWLPGVDLDKIWAQGNETVADWFGASDHNGEHLVNVENNPYIRPNQAHPNQLGHELIANKLQAWIEQQR